MKQNFFVMVWSSPIKEFNFIFSKKGLVFHLVEFNRDSAKKKKLIQLCVSLWNLNVHVSCMCLTMIVEHLKTWRKLYIDVIKYTQNNEIEYVEVNFMQTTQCSAES